MLTEERRLKKNKYQREWKKRNRKKHQFFSVRWVNNNPWYKHYRYAIARCKNDDNYKKFKVSITVQDVKNLWFRDNAFSLESPTIDRIDDNIGYEVNNCRFIERKENARRAFFKGCVKLPKVIQKDINNNVVNEFDSVMDASRETGICSTSIYRNIKKLQKHAGKFTWELKF